VEDFFGEERDCGSGEVDGKVLRVELLKPFGGMKSGRGGATPNVGLSRIEPRHPSQPTANA
jgi:hypothetical protein